MPRRPGFTLVFASETIEHLDQIERKQHRLIEEAINEQLTYTPVEETRNRKPLRQPAPFEATWELRCGPENQYRVFYEVNLDERTVSILAIGIKQRSRLFIGGEEFTS
jgi:mRNA-degrading endonuclease RelE of RelBE toxin-antitoxin system